MECKDLGENRFIFTFLQATGKRRALEDGPWMFGKDLVVMAEFDGAKTIDEVEFNSIPIWVQVLKMPLGLMNKTAGEMIGEMIGEVLEVDADDDDMAFGQYLRIKIRLNILKPLMRGVTLDLGDEEKKAEKWCPLVYEFLPDFCYTCGIIGHTGRLCEIQLEKGAVQQFSKALRFIPDKKSGSELSGRSSGNRQNSMCNTEARWSGCSGSWGSGGRKGSDDRSWRKDAR